jgi:hypothetical protein
MSATIIPFQEGHVFDPTMMVIMGEAYDLARNELRARGVSDDALAILIIEICKTGEKDARRICDRAVMTFEALEDLGAVESQRPQR